MNVSLYIDRWSLVILAVRLTTQKTSQLPDNPPVISADWQDAYNFSLDPAAYQRRMGVKTNCFSWQVLFVMSHQCHKIGKNLVFRKLKFHSVSVLFTHDSHSGDRKHICDVIIWIREDKTTSEGDVGVQLIQTRFICARGGWNYQNRTIHVYVYMMYIHMYITESTYLEMGIFYDFEM